MTEDKAARRACQHNRAHAHASGQREKIISNFERGSLVFGVIFAVSFGLMFVHAAVAL